MKRLFVLVYLLALMHAQKSMGQDTSSKVAVVFSPALFVPVTVAAQAGVQFKLGKGWSLLAEGAYPGFYPDNTAYEKITYWRTGIEVKHYLAKRKASRYVSLQNTFLFRELVNKGDGIYYTKTQTFAYSNAVIQSPVWASAIKIGLELPLGKRTYFDLFTGAGLRMIFTNYKSESALVTSIQPNKQSFLTFDNAWEYNYTLKRIHATAGIRFGFRL
jgi:hypothetical protein